MTLTDIFCSSQVILPQSGQILIAGGDNWTGTGTTNTGNNNSNIFDTFGNTLARCGQHEPRPLVFVVDRAHQRRRLHSGRQRRRRFPRSAAAAMARSVCSRRPGRAASTPTFPRNFLAPDGRVFGYDTTGRCTTSTRAARARCRRRVSFSRRTPAGPRAPRCSARARSCRWAATRTARSSSTSTARCPRSRTTQPMSTQRQWVSATVLPDGKVLATGGSEVENQLTDVNNRAEIWDPATGTWHVGTAACRRGCTTRRRCCCPTRRCSSRAAARRARRSIRTRRSTRRRTCSTTQARSRRGRRSCRRRAKPTSATRSTLEVRAPCAA